MPKELRPATAAEAIEGLKAVEERKAAREASAVTDLSGVFDRPEVWGSVAYLSMCHRTGSATTIRIIHSSIAQLKADGSIDIFAYGGQTFGPPAIQAAFTVPSGGIYTCTVRLQRSDPTVGVYEFRIDGEVFGSFDINPDAPTDYTFATRWLAPGFQGHQFSVAAHTASFRFYSLTVLQVPEIAPS
jgi:hypothetical protein